MQMSCTFFTHVNWPKLLGPKLLGPFEVGFNIDCFLCVCVQNVILHHFSGKKSHNVFLNKCNAIEST